MLLCYRCQAKCRHKQNGCQAIHGDLPLVEFTSVCLGTFLKEFYTAVFNPAVCERAAFRCSKISCGEALKQDGRFAIIGRHFGHRRIWPEGRTPVMTDVTILFLDGT